MLRKSRNKSVKNPDNKTDENTVLPEDSFIDGEDQFKNKDHMGLFSKEIPGHPLSGGESQELVFYAKMYLSLELISLLQGMAILFIYSYISYDKMNKSFRFIRNYNFDYMFVVWYIIWITRKYAVVHTNAARLPARVDRPDQYVYQIMAKSGDLVDAPYVRLANTGAQGRFNRAQRAAGHMDESIALFTTGSLLSTFAVGPVLLPILIFWAVNRVNFVNVYKESNNKRTSAARMCIYMEGTLFFYASINSRGRLFEFF